MKRFFWLKPPRAGETRAGETRAGETRAGETRVTGPARTRAVAPEAPVPPVVPVVTPPVVVTPPPPKPGRSRDDEETRPIRVPSRPPPAPPSAQGSVAQGSVAQSFVAQGSVAQSFVAQGSVAKGSVAQGSVAQGSVAQASVAQASAAQGSAQTSAAQGVGLRPEPSHVVACGGCGAKNRVPFVRLAERSRCARCQDALTPIRRPLALESEAALDALARSPVPVLLDFWASWSGPCGLVALELEKLAEELAGAVVVAKIDVDQRAALARRFDVQSVPTFVLLREGAVVARETGALPAHVLRKRFAL